MYHSNKFILFILILLLTLCCQKDSRPLFFEDGSNAIQFPNFQSGEFQPGKTFSDETKVAMYYKHISKGGGKPNIFIAREYTIFPYEILQNGKRQGCPPGFLLGYPQYFNTLSTHTEVLNDSTFLLGALWYESSDVNRISYKTDGSIGWQASILQPSSTTYINLWHESSEITLDSLVDWSLKMREGIIITIGER